MRGPDVLSWNGRLVWLTPAQGGRETGPPRTPDDQDFAATAFLPPETVESGLASIVIRAADRQSWVTPAQADWLIVDSANEFRVVPGAILVITEGRREVAYLTIESVSA